MREGKGKGREGKGREGKGRRWDGEATDGTGGGVTEVKGTNNQIFFPPSGQFSFPLNVVPVEPCPLTTPLPLPPLPFPLLPPPHCPPYFIFSHPLLLFFYIFPISNFPPFILHIFPPPYFPLFSLLSLFLLPYFFVNFSSLYSHHEYYFPFLSSSSSCQLPLHRSSIRFSTNRRECLKFPYFSSFPL